MFRTHPEVLAAEETLAELRSQLENATGDKEADLQFKVTAQTRVVEELRWAHSPRPLFTKDNLMPVESVPVAADGEPYRAY